MKYRKVSFDNCIMVYLLLDGFLAMSEGIAWKISEFQEGIKPQPCTFHPYLELLFSCSLSHWQASIITAHRFFPFGVKLALMQNDCFPNLCKILFEQFIGCAINYLANTIYIFSFMTTHKFFFVFENQLMNSVHLVWCDCYFNVLRKW